MEKIAELTTATGTYQENGQTKYRNMNAGVMFKGDGNRLAVIGIPKWLNLAALPSRPDSDYVYFSAFRPKEKQSQPQRQQTQQTQQRQPQDNNNFANFEEIPF